MLEERARQEEVKLMEIDGNFCVPRLLLDEKIC